jgi:aminobenzoyl-glutamate utilization protein B
VLISVLALALVAQDSIAGSFEDSDAWLAAHAAELQQINQRIWSAAEVGLQEHESSATLIAFLEQNGFAVTRGVAGMPTAFVAEIGNGQPIVGILAEYDALPGVSQAAAPERGAREGGPDAGHACGHSLFGTASTAGAIAAATVARGRGLAGTIRLYGTPAEETGIGKVYMARAGLFDDLDLAFHWHPADRTRSGYASSKAVVSIKFRFHGRNAHASLSPEAGRSALDAVELMNVGVNYLREHLKDDARVHYVITDGGGQPNVVPPTAEVWYYLRADSHAYVETILERVRKCAQGACQMTETTVTEQMDSDLYEILPNLPLSQLFQRHLERVGPPPFDEAERAFARRTQVDLAVVPSEPLSTVIDPLPSEFYRHPASSDVGNVSWIVPTSGFSIASYTNGAPGHSWQVVACGGMSIGEKALLCGARVMAAATLESLQDPTVVADAARDFAERTQAVQAPTSVLPPDAKAPERIR